MYFDVTSMAVRGICVDNNVWSEITVTTVFGRCIVRVFGQEPSLKLISSIQL